MSNVKNITMEAFNVVNHKLNATQQAVFNRFMSDDFCGACVGTHIIDVFEKTSDDHIKSNIAEKLNLVNNGVLFSVNTNTILENIDVTEETKGNFFFIKYPLNMNQDIANVYSDDFEAEVISLAYENITQLNLDKYGTYEDDIAYTGIPVYHQTTITFDDVSEIGKTFIYRGQTCVVSDYGIIPLFAITQEGNVISILAADCKASLEDWLSAQALHNLWDELNSTFTHQAGSDLEHPDYGRVGNFVFNGDDIQNTNHQPIIKVVDNESFQLPTFSWPSVETTVDKNGVVRESPTADAVFVDNSGNVAHNALPIEAGGTGSRNRYDAKVALGFHFGWTSPEEHIFNETPMYGEVYFKLLGK